MWHLTPGALIDVVEGTQAEQAFPHLTTCVRCRQQLADLRAALSVARSDIDVPEPSPLFWDHLSSRVREAVAAEAAAPRSTTFGWVTWRSAALGSAVVLAFAVALFVHLAPREARVPAAPASVGVRSEDHQIGSPTLTEAPFSFVAELAESLDWDTAAEAGLTTRLGSVDRTLTDLSSDESVALERLLNEALTKPGA